jgi:hypothetical protein
MVNSRSNPAFIKNDAGSLDLDKEVIWRLIFIVFATKSQKINEWITYRCLLSEHYYISIGHVYEEEKEGKIEETERDAVLPKTYQL